MKEITIGDKSLMQISKEDILQLAVMQGCCAHLDFWNYPTLLEYDNTMFSDTVVISYKSTRKEDGIDSSKEAGKLLISIIAAVAEMERETIRVQ